MSMGNTQKQISQSVTDELQLPSKERILDFLRKGNEGLKSQKEGLG